MRLFNNPRGVVYLIVAFLVTFFLLRECEADEGTIELGPTPDHGIGLVYTERLHKWDLGLMLMSDQSRRNGKIKIDNNGGFMVQRVVKWRGVELGLGGAGWVNTNPLIGCHLGFSLSIRYNITPRVPITWRHWSNAGTCEPNRGQDMLSIGWRF